LRIHENLWQERDYLSARDSGKREGKRGKREKGENEEERVEIRIL
jgi:hypothetical protein